MNSLLSGLASTSAVKNPPCQEGHSEQPLGPISEHSMTTGTFTMNAHPDAQTWLVDFMWVEWWFGMTCRFNVSRVVVLIGLVCRCNVGQAVVLNDLVRRFNVGRAVVVNDHPAWTRSLLPSLSLSATIWLAPMGQGLTLVHFSAQLEPCLTQENTLHTLNTPSTRATQPLRAPPIPHKALKFSCQMDECKPLPWGSTRR
jgi:hypothetical protein